MLNVTVNEKVLQFRYFSHNTVSVEIIFEQKYYNFQTFCCSNEWKFSDTVLRMQQFLHGTATYSLYAVMYGLLWYQRPVVKNWRGI